MWLNPDRGGFLDETVMNMVFKKCALCLLLLLGAAGAFARPGGGDQGGRFAAREGPPGQYAQQRGGPGPAERPNENRRGQDQGNYQGAPAAGRPGRMTPDERRALRRQINEAGQDLYRPKR